MKKELRIGLLGFGSMGKVHSYAVSNLRFYYDSLPFSARIVGVCTTSIEKSEKICRDFGFEIPCDNEDTLINRPDIDIIDVCTPNIYHYETLKKAIIAGKHIYCEKPLCVSYAQAEEIRNLCTQNPGKIRKIVFNNRYIPAVMRAKQLIDQGKIGRILSFDASYLHSSAVNINKTAGWKQNKDICGGGVLFDLGSHIIDLVYYLVGDFDSVTTATQIAYPTRIGMDGKLWATNADEAFYLLAKMKNGSVGTIRGSKIAVGANDDLSFEVFGEKGSLKYSLMEPNWLHYYDNTSEPNDPPLGGCRGYTRIECVGRYTAPGGKFPSPKAPVGWIRGHVESMYDFLNSVSIGTQSSPSFDDGAYIQKIMEKAYLSAQSGKWEGID